VEELNSVSRLLNVRIALKTRQGLSHSTRTIFGASLVFKSTLEPNQLLVGSWPYLKCLTSLKILQDKFLAIAVFHARVLGYGTCKYA
jgi:hypothetical protein